GDEHEMDPCEGMGRSGRLVVVHVEAAPVVGDPDAAVDRGVGDADGVVAGGEPLELGHVRVADLADGVGGVVDDVEGSAVGGDGHRAGGGGRRDLGDDLAGGEVNLRDLPLG